MPTTFWAKQAKRKGAKIIATGSCEETKLSHARQSRCYIK